MDPINPTVPTVKSRLPIFIVGGAVVVIVGLAVGFAIWRSRVPASGTPSAATPSPAAQGNAQPSSSVSGATGAAAKVPGMTQGSGPFSINTDVAIPAANTPTFGEDIAATAAEKRAWGYPADAEVIYRWTRSIGGGAMRVIVSAPAPAPQEIPAGEPPAKKPPAS